VQVFSKKNDVWYFRCILGLLIHGIRIPWMIGEPGILAYMHAYALLGLNVCFLGISGVCTCGWVRKDVCTVLALRFKDRIVVCWRKSRFKGLCLVKML
jgi:hypothetical protein